jgi:hypothetical protein
MHLGQRAPPQTAREDVVPTAAALSPELTQLLQSMARDLATLGQGIEQLRASQDHAGGCWRLRVNRK